MKRTSDIHKKPLDLILSLSGIAIAMLIAMTIYESLKQILFPSITIWQSHAITIIFSTIIASISGYHVLRKQIGLTSLLIKKNAESEILQEQLEANIQQLNLLLSEVKTLSGMLPICASCKKIRDDKGYWNQIESYIKEHSNADFTHGICPECAHKLYPGFVKEIDTPPGNKPARK